MFGNVSRLAQKEGGFANCCCHMSPPACPILIVMSPARASSAARTGPARAGPGVSTGSLPPRAPRWHRHRPRARLPPPPPAQPLCLSARPALPGPGTRGLRGAVTISAEPLATNRWLLFHTNACLRLYVLHLFVANTCHSINRFGHLM